MSITQQVDNIWAETWKKCGNNHVEIWKSRGSVSGKEALKLEAKIAWEEKERKNNKSKNREGLGKGDGVYIIVGPHKDLDFALSKVDLVEEWYAYTYILGGSP